MTAIQALPIHSTWDDGTIRELGRIEGRRREGTWRRFFRHGRPEEESHYRAGVLHGASTTWYPTGQLRSELSWREGVLNGPFATWHPNGRSSTEGEYLHGRPHRLFTRSWPSGRRMLEGEFDRGTPVGQWRAWTPEGELVHCGPWVDDLNVALPRGLQQNGLATLQQVA